MRKYLATILAIVCLNQPAFTNAQPSVEDTVFWDQIANYGKANSDTQKEALAKQIWDQYGATKTIVVIDTSGFTARSVKQGILNTLVVINELSEIVSRDVSQTNGKVMKFEADDAFLLFDTPEEAVAVLLKIQQDLKTSYINQGSDSKISIAAAVGYGRVLLLKHDAFSEVLNITSKLGEDTAEGGEILLTEAAYKALKKPIKNEEKSTNISNVTIKYYKVLE